MHRKDSPQDIVIMAVIGVTLLALLPAQQAAPVGANANEALGGTAHGYSKPASQTTSSNR